MYTIFNWFIWVVVFSVVKFLYTLHINPLTDVGIVKILSQPEGHYFVLFCLIEAFQFPEVSFIIFDLRDWTIARRRLWEANKKSFLLPTSSYWKFGLIVLKLEGNKNIARASFFLWFGTNKKSSGSQVLRGPAVQRLAAWRKA